jgi:hypothetical protein
MSRFVKCKSIVYDNENGFWWAWFSYTDDEDLPEVEFRMPVNPGDFEVDGLYRMRFKKFDEI